MATVIVRGYGDDSILFEGSVENAINVINDNPVNIGFSTGTLLQVEKDDQGVWRIKIVFKGIGQRSLVKKMMNADDVLDDEGASDVFILDGVVRWIVLGMEVS